MKGTNVIDSEPTEVPEALMAERERLGFDYGKFDYVVHRGTPILLDANKTPAHRRGGMGDRLKIFCQGLDSLLPPSITSK